MVSSCKLTGDCRVRFLMTRPEGRPGMSDVSPLSGISGLSVDSTLLSPLLFFCLVLLLFLFYLFFLCLQVHSPKLFFRKILIYFSLGDRLFYGSSLAARRSKLVGGMSSMLPCCHVALVFAVIHLYTSFFDLSIPFFL